MPQTNSASLHDAYAADYDDQVQNYDCHMTDVLFGLTFEYIQPGQKLLDAGIGSGLSSLPFVKAGLITHGMDFSFAMLEICQPKAVALTLAQHDIQQVPWPYPSGTFDVLVCCGVMHFIPDLDGIFYEASRVVHNGGWFAFSAKCGQTAAGSPKKYHHQIVGGFDIFAHTTQYLERLLGKAHFTRRKVQKCFVGEDLFEVWVAQKK